MTGLISKPLLDNLELFLHSLVDDILHRPIEIIFILASLRQYTQ